MDALFKWFVIFVILVILLYKYGTKNYDYWEKKGVQQLNPLPFIGDNIFGVLIKKDLLEISRDLYKPFKGKRFGGLYMGQKRLLAVTDPELLKVILVKETDVFHNRMEMIVSSDPLVSRSLLALRDESWRKLRAVMTTVFTSAKMRDMFCFMSECGKQAIEFLDEKIMDHAKSGKGTYEMNIKDFYSRYGIDVIGSTAFGLNVNSFKNATNDFYEAGNILRKIFGTYRVLKVFFMMIFPGISKILGLTLFGEKYNNFLISVVQDSIREREEKKIVRKDVIHILMEARKGKGVDENGEPINGKLPDLTDIDIAAQGVLFFVAGFEAVSSVLAFASFELAINPDIHEKLQEEIDEVVERENGITYDGIIHQMHYLHMVMSEVLRKWPANGLTDRSVSKTYVIPKTEKSPEVVLEKGDIVFVPILGFHYDPEYFPEPHKFDPERFRDEKNTIKPFTYLPFGEGIRHCVGMRYALLKAKVIIVHILRKYSFVPGKKTKIPLKLEKAGAFGFMLEGGFDIGIKPRV